MDLAEIAERCRKFDKTKDEPPIWQRCKDESGCEIPLHHNFVIDVFIKTLQGLEIGLDATLINDEIRVTDGTKTIVVPKSLPLLGTLRFGDYKRQTGLHRVWDATSFVLSKLQHPLSKIDGARYIPNIIEMYALEAEKEFQGRIYRTP